MTLTISTPVPKLAKKAPDKFSSYVSDPVHVVGAGWVGSGALGIVTVRSAMTVSKLDSASKSYIETI